jgi:hypothetical protein
MKYIRLIIIALLLYPFLGISQDLKMYVGAGIPDLLHAEVSISISEKNEIGLQIGTGFSDNILLTPTLEHRFYFKESKKFQELKTWFFAQRVTFLYEKSDEYRWNTVFLNFSIGRNVNINRKLGISFDGGLLATLYDKQFKTADGSEVIDDSPTFNPGIFPNLRIQFFYKF